MTLPLVSGLVTFADVTDAVEAALAEGIPGLLSRLSPGLPSPTVVSRQGRVPGDAEDTPWLVATSTGLPELLWDGSAFTGSFDVVVTLAVRGEDWQQTRENLAAYDAAVRCILATNTALVSTAAPDGFARSVSGIRAAYVSTEDDRTYLEADVSCVVTVDDVIRLDGGPDVTALTARVQLIHPALE